MRDLTERAYFALCRALGRALKSTKYSKVSVVHEGGELQVRKARFSYAPLLLWMSSPLYTILDAGVRILPQREWEAREREIYWRIYSTSTRVDAHDVLVLPRLTGQTLASVLEDRTLEQSVRERAIEWAVIALARLHQLGFTHGDAMADNVMIDLEAGAAHWFDFETIHEPSRASTWRRADDVRALAAACLVRTLPEEIARTLELILKAYADEEVTRLLATSFRSVWRRSLPFHLSQATLSLQYFRTIGRLLRV